MAGYSLTYNGTAMNVYGLIVNSHRLSLDRIYDSIQTQDRAWAGKGQAAPVVITLQVTIVGTSREQILDRFSTLRGLFDQEEEEELKLDRYIDRYWMAKFDSFIGDFTKKNIWEGTLIFTCHDGKAYANAPISGAPQTFDYNESIDYGGTIRGLAVDSDYVYVVGDTTRKVYKLSKIDLIKICESASYGGNILSICVDSTHVYIGGETTSKVRKLLASDLSFVADSPSYASTISAVVQYGNYIYYGGGSAGGHYHIKKLLKSDMTTIIESPDVGNWINALVTNATHIICGGEFDGAGHSHVKRYSIIDLSYVDESDNYAGIINALALDSTNVYCCGTSDTVWKITLADMTAETASADLGGDLYALAVDDTYIYAMGTDQIIRKLLISDMSLIANSGVYGNTITTCCIDLVEGNLYIGGATTQAVWKLDTRHLPLHYESEDYGGEIYEIAQDDVYIYFTGDMTHKLIKVRRSDMVKVAESIDYGVAPATGISAVAIYGDYVYIGGDTPKTVWKLNKSDLTKICESPTYDSINCIEVDATYVYAGDSGGIVRKLNIADLTWVANSPDYTTIRCMCSDTNFLYAGGSLDCKVRKITKATMAIAASSADLGTLYFDICCDASYVYAVGWFTDNKVSQLNIADLSANAQSKDYGAMIYAISQDTLYVYIGGTTTQQVWKILKSTMVTDAKAASYGGDIGTLALDDGFIYVGGATTQTIQKLDKRILWRRSDHELTVTTVGTARTNPLITLTANGANYWAQTIENTTTSQEFQWEGTQPTTEVLEVDSDMWSVELQGVSALSGQSGDFVQLAPGANVLYFENVVGTVEVDYTDRFA